MRPSPTDHSITQLAALIEALPAAEEARARRLFAVQESEAHMRLTPPMRGWAERTFGPAEALERQSVVRVSNLVTGEGALFNSLRARRPLQTGRTSGWTGGDAVARALEDDPWADPLAATPEEPGGRLSNEHALTAANIASYDALHTILVHRNSDPLAFTADSLKGQLALAGQWMRQTHAAHPEARYPYLLWNCLWRAGGSVVHGHMQALVARERAYAKVERLRRDIAAYRAEHGADYFTELTATHRALGLAVDLGPVTAMASLTPLKEKEVVLLAPALDDGALAVALAHVLGVLRDDLGVRSFNVGVLLPPLGGPHEGWEGFPVIAQVVDRGGLDARTSDFGGMELFAESVVASDPFALATALRAGGEAG
ncbi:MAG: hypothetical protein VW450_05810 [Chloroflexota bacterium]